jgi:hypothetical protein
MASKSKPGTATDFFDITLTLDCNNDCVFCPRSELKRVLVPLERLEPLLKKHRGGVVLTGGEPTLLPDLPALVKRCKQLGCKRVGVITNGRRVSDKKYMRALVSAGLDEITISIYSHLPAVHDKYTRKKGSCAQSWLGLRNAMATGIDVKVNMVLTAKALPQTPKTLGMFKAMGLRQVVIIDPVGSQDYADYGGVAKLQDGMKDCSFSYPELVVFRGYPLCVLIPRREMNEIADMLERGTDCGCHLRWEGQHLESAGGVGEKNFDKYRRSVTEGFSKPKKLCSGCPADAVCAGIQKGRKL